VATIKIRVYHIPTTVSETTCLYAPYHRFGASSPPNHRGTPLSYYYPDILINVDFPMVTNIFI